MARSSYIGKRLNEKEFEVMLQGMTIEPHCTCTKCGGKGYAEVRCQTIIKTGHVRQCSHPATHQVNGVPCCHIHYLKQYRDYKKGIKK
jgi:hypothetical protein